MGCIVGGNIKGSNIEINNDINNTNVNQTLDNGSPFGNQSYSKQKNVFLIKNNTQSNLINSKTNCSTSLFNNLNETLILKFSKDLNQNYEIISIKQNILQNKNNEIKIMKECPSHAIFSFGGEIEKYNESENSSSFRSSHFNESEEVDYIIQENNIQPHQFDIEYFDGKYYIKGYNDGSGIFLKIDDKILIEPEEKFIFLFNKQSFLNILINEEKNLIFIDYNGENKGEFNYLNKNIIFIGRCQNCDVMISNDDGVSRVQFTFLYDKSNNLFYIYDGFYSVQEKKIKPSTNGIWLLINNNKILIKNEMIFKTGKTLILCQYKTN